MNVFRLVRRLDWPVVVAVFALVLFTWPYMRSASYRSGPEGRGEYTSSPWAVSFSVSAVSMIWLRNTPPPKATALMFVRSLSSAASLAKTSMSVR